MRSARRVMSSRLPMGVPTTKRVRAGSLTACVMGGSLSLGEARGWGHGATKVLRNICVRKGIHSRLREQDGDQDEGNDWKLALQFAARSRSQAKQPDGDSAFFCD